MANASLDVAIPVGSDPNAAQKMRALVRMNNGLIPRRRRQIAPRSSVKSTHVVILAIGPGDILIPI
jgi:hypothetical protein